MNLLSIIFAIIVLLQLSEGNDVCEARYHVISSLLQSNCPADVIDESGKVTHKYYIFPHGGDHDCFPYCRKIKTELNLYQFCSDENVCPPGYLCEGKEEEKHCVLDDNSCFKYYVNYAKPDASYFRAMWRPECLPDGTWAPKQCKGEKATGRCFCFDAVGTRLDGHQWWRLAENMTCACSRKRAEMMSDKSIGFVSLHCDDEGNYEPMQCNDGQCWCVHPPTGEVLSKVVPESMWKKLSCYDDVLNGNQYMRQCESKLYAQKKIVNELHTHGTIGFEYESILCDADGTYGIYSVADNIASCVWKDGKPLGFALNLAEGDVSSMDCKCARDLKIFELGGQDPKARGSCDGKGNYMEIQVKVIDGESKYYCVDEDGFQKGPVVDKKPTNCFSLR